MPGCSRMPKEKTNKLKTIIDQWGGGVSLFFCYTHLSHDMTTGLLVALLPFIREDLALNYFQAGLLVSAYSVTSGISQIFGGWVGDRIKRRWITISMGLTGVGISGLVAGLMPSYISLLIAMIIMGVFAGAYHPSAVPAISSIFHDRRGKAIGLHMIGGSLGFGIGPFIGTAIAATMGWHWAFIILCLPSLIAAVWVALWLRRIEPAIPVDRAAAEAGVPQDTATVGQVLKSAALIITLVVLVTFTSGSLLPFVPLYLVDHHGMSSTVAAIWTSVIRASGIPGSLLGGWLSDRWGNKQTVLLSLISIGPAILLFSYTGNIAVLGIIMVSIGILWAMRETAVQTYLMGRTPLRLHGIVFGIYFGIGQQGQSLMQPVYGGFMDMLGVSNVFIIVGFISVAISLTTALLARKL